MAVKICGIEPHSIAARAGIRAGEELISINSHEISDVLDFRFYETENRLVLQLKEEDGSEREVLVRKTKYASLGMEFESYLMDKQRHCRNRCMFCFIDQLPEGMRESLYFKDDDDRLSFLFGNYITLTNLTQHEVDRIIEMHISPINVSVHTTNPELRCKMMGNRFAGEALNFLYQLAERGAQLNCQLVLCPGVNDGEELSRSLRDLEKLAPAVESIAVVPVGLTKFREKLPHIEPYTAESAAAVIDTVEAFATQCVEKHGVRLAYAADEFYLKAGRELPDDDSYDGYPQLDNGIGGVTLLRTQFMAELAEISADKNRPERTVSIATGTSAAPILRELLDELEKKCNNITCHVYAIENDFFGHQINVAGLVAGGDLIRQLTGKELGEELLIPSVMLRNEQDVFLDDVSREDVVQALGVPLSVVGEDGEDLLHCVLGE